MSVVIPVAIVAAVTWLVAPIIDRRRRWGRRGIFIAIPITFVRRSRRNGAQSKQADAKPQQSATVAATVPAAAMAVTAAIPPAVAKSATVKRLGGRNGASQ